MASPARGADVPVPASMTALSARPAASRSGVWVRAMPSPPGKVRFMFRTLSSVRYVTCMAHPADLTRLIKAERAAEKRLRAARDNTDAALRSAHEATGISLRPDGQDHRSHCGDGPLPHHTTTCHGQGSPAG